MPSSADIIRKVKAEMGDQLISAIYSTRILPMRTRRYELNAPTRKADIEIMHTLLGIELKVGNRRMICPDLSTARYLSVFARLGISEVAVPYDITQIARLADDLEASWHRMLVLLDHYADGSDINLKRRTRSAIIRQLRKEISAEGSGPAVPEFNQNTSQRRRK